MQSILPKQSDSNLNTSKQNWRFIFPKNTVDLIVSLMFRDQVIKTCHSVTQDVETKVIVHCHATMLIILVEDEKRNSLLSMVQDKKWNQYKINIWCWCWRGFLLPDQSLSKQIWMNNQISIFYHCNGITDMKSMNVWQLEIWDGDTSKSHSQPRHGSKVVIRTIK